MRLETTIEKVDTQMGMDKFLDFVESQMKRGSSAAKMSSLCPVKIGEVAMEKLLDLWYPGYSELKIVERKCWRFKVYPMLYLERKASTLTYDSSHPYFKHFTRKNFMNYFAQKSMAGKRGVEFKFDFHGWILWWLLTGHFDERGPGNDQYQMCRKNDSGAYEWDNIYCDTGLQNKKDYIRK